jgi:outer membrane autotransporter protein
LGNLSDEASNGFWIAGNGVNGRQGSKDGFAGYKNSGWGMSGGFDRRLAPGRFVGAAVSHSDSLLTYRDQSTGDDADIANTQVSLYGTQGVGRVFIEGMATYGRQKYDTTRNTGVAGVAAGSFDGHLWGFRIGGGVPIALWSHASITPQVGLDWDSVKQDAYTETGGSPLALSVESRSADRFRSSVGGQIDFASALGDLKVRPFLRGFWRHNLSDDGLDSSAKFVSGGASFITPGEKLDSNPYTLGAGINFYTRGSLTAALAYDGNFAEGYHSHVYQAKVRWAF